MISRRSLLVSTAIIPAAALAGCASWENTMQTIAADVNLIASGLQSVLKMASAAHVPGITPDILNVATLALSGLASSSQALLGASSTAEAQPIVQKVGTYVAAFLGAVAVLALPPPIPTIVTAALIVLPLVETAVGLVVPSKPMVAAARVAPAMTPDQARTVLATAGS